MSDIVRDLRAMSLQLGSAKILCDKAANEIHRLNVYLHDARTVSDRWASEAMRLRDLVEDNK